MRKILVLIAVIYYLFFSKKEIQFSVAINQKVPVDTVPNVQIETDSIQKDTIEDDTEIR